MAPITPILAACGAASGPEAGCSVVLRASVVGRDELQTALTEAPDGATICVSGTFDIRTDRVGASGKRGLTLRGVDEGTGATFDFHDVVGPNGLKFSAMTDFTLEDLTVRNVVGDAIEVRGSERVVLRRLRVEWTGGGDPNTRNYGLYPVESHDVLVEGCETSSSQEAGIYAGQSTNVVIRGNRSFANLMGVQLENTRDAEVVGNELFDNTVGVAVMDVPLLPAGNGGGALVADNLVRANNRGTTAKDRVNASYPHGVGVLVIAHDRVEIRDNLIAGNVSAGVAILSFRTVDQVLPSSRRDARFDPDPTGVFVHGNRLSDNGARPDPLFQRLGLPRRSDITWDGLSQPGVGPHGGLCVRRNHGAVLATPGGVLAGPDAVRHECTLPALAPVGGAG